MEAQFGAFQILLWRTPLVRAVTAFLALAIVVLAGLTFVTRDTSATRIAYCATNIDGPGAPLNVSVMQWQADAQMTLLTGETEVNGCGEFQTIPRDRPVMIVVWTDDGFSTGSTGWLDPDNVTGTLAIELESQASPLVD